MSKRLDLVGTAEAAEVLGVEVQRITRWRKAGKLPAPAAELAATAVWHRADIEACREGGEPPTNVRRLTSILGLAEVANELGVNKSQIGRWRRAGKFPEPICHLTAGPLWLRKDVRAWARKRTS